MKIVKINRIRIIEADSPNDRLFAVTRKVMTRRSGNNDGYVFSEHISPDHWPSYQQHHSFSLETMKAVSGLVAIPGVLSVSVKFDHLIICKGLAYDWEDIQSSILSVLRDAYFEEAFNDVVVHDAIAAAAKAKAESAAARPAGTATPKRN
jgi:hypothetical protein